MKINSLLIAFCFVALIYSPLTGNAAEQKPSSSAASASPAANAPRPFPFHGMVSAVDQKAKTFTIAGKEKSRVFKITDKTVVTKGASTATIKDIAENQEVSGSYWKNADGSLEAKTVKVGPMKAADKSAKTSPSPSVSPKKP